MQPGTQRKDDAENGRGIKNAVACGKNAYRERADSDLVPRLDEAHARRIQPVLFGMGDACCRDIDGAHALGEGVHIRKVIKMRVCDEYRICRARLCERNGHNARVFL